MCTKNILWYIPKAAYFPDETRTNSFSRRLYDYSKNSEVAFGSSFGLKKNNHSSQVQEINKAAPGI